MLVGVLALQGSVAEHIEILKKINVDLLKHMWYNVSVNRNISQE